MELWPVDGYLPISSDSESQASPNDDLRIAEIVTNASISDSHALDNTVSNHSIPPRLSGQSMLASKDLQKPGK